MMRQRLKGMGAATARVWRKRKNPPQRLECECGLISGRLTKWIVGKGIRGNRSQSISDYLEGLEQGQIASILCNTASSTLGTAYEIIKFFSALRIGHLYNRFVYLIFRVLRVKSLNTSPVISSGLRLSTKFH